MDTTTIERKMLEIITAIDELNKWLETTADHGGDTETAKRFNILGRAGEVAALLVGIGEPADGEDTFKMIVDIAKSPKTNFATLRDFFEQCRIQGWR